MSDQPEETTDGVKITEDDREKVQSQLSNWNEGLYSDDYEDRREATKKIRRLAQYHPEEIAVVCGKLRNLVKQDERHVRVNALEALIATGKHEPEEIRTLIGTSISLLYDENAKIREVALRLLIVATEHYPEKVRPAIPRIVELLDDSNELPRGPAAKALSQIAYYYPSDVKSEEVLARLDQMTNPDRDELSRGPELVDEQIEHAEKALERIEEATKKGAIQLPEHLLDEELRLRVTEHFENNQFQAAIQQSFITLEERIRSKGNFSYNDHGTSLVSEAFHYENGPLSFGQTEAERRGVMLLYKSAFQTFRNPSSHRFLDNMDSRHAHNIICFVNLLLILLGPHSE